MKNNTMTDDHFGARPGAEDRDTHQRHVIAALWVSLAFFVVLMSALIYGESHGIFQPSGLGPNAPWPAGWP